MFAKVCNTRSSGYPLMNVAEDGVDGVISLDCLVDSWVWWSLTLFFLIIFLVLIIVMVISPLIIVLLLRWLIFMVFIFVNLSLILILGR